jgi:hypothetical protein
MAMKMLALVLAIAAFAGCEEKKVETAPPPVTRKVVDSSKAGQIATYRCECTKKEWQQPAEEEKLCLEYCKGKMPECGELVKVEPAPK